MHASSSRYFVIRVQSSNVPLLSQVGNGRLSQVQRGLMHAELVVSQLGCVIQGEKRKP
jgi:hypothetical protein